MPLCAAVASAHPYIDSANETLAAERLAKAKPPGCERPYKLGLFKAQLRRSFSKKRWKDPTPVKPRERRKLRHYKRCARTPWHARRMRQLERKARKAHRERRRVRLDRRRERRALLPYRGPDGRRWAIPWHIVRCESGGSWTAYNPSGAAGPYQIMPEHGRPWPVRSRDDRMAHHRIAAGLWSGGSGARNWVCAW